MRFRAFPIIAGLLLAAGPLAAQTPPVPLPTPAEMEEMRKTAQRMMDPAANALAHRAELKLTDQQVAALGPITEQMSVVLQRTMAEGASRAGGHLAQAMEDPSVEIDEERIREESCEQSRSQAAIAVAMLRARRAVDAVLTPSQRETLQGLQTSFGLQLMQQMMRPPVKH